MTNPTSVASAWTLLLVAAAFEVAFAMSLKYTHGFTRPAASLLTLLLAVFSLVMLTRTLSVLPVGTAYAAWTGIGAVGAVVLGVILFHEPVSLSRALSVALVILGVVGLRLGGTESSPGSPDEPPADTSVQVGGRSGEGDGPPDRVSAMRAP